MNMVIYDTFIHLFTSSEKNLFTSSEKYFNHSATEWYTAFKHKMKQNHIASKQIEFKRLMAVMVDWLMARIRADNCIELQLIGVNHEINELAERSRTFVLSDCSQKYKRIT